ncbi:MAG: phosphotransferase, partial [Bacteroidales bacterium]|nr:phosphotransferase [Bacteroidales bacterium]
TVPEVYTSNLDEKIYIQQDLGDISLFDLVQKNSGLKLSSEIEQLYKQSINELIKFQVEAGKDLDFSYCFPRIEFDGQSMQWDLNYFKYYSLKFHNIQFHEEKLEKDFQTIIKYLSKAASNYFMYRDFQTRNILIYQNKPYFIDYQGGRKGPLQYDLASLLFQAKADLPYDFRKQMLEYYKDKLTGYVEVDNTEFTKQYYGFVLLRTLQVLGAYGFRGYYEKKPHFMESLSYAIKNVDWLLDNIKFKFDFPELKNSLQLLSENFKANQIKKTIKKLTVEINSFSYIYMGIPSDKSDHGGGFVFDCRSIPNPGRYMEYRDLSGLDKPVIDFLKKEAAVDKFNQLVFDIVSSAIDNYIDRNFDHLMINFGCTGGQHRSVFCAEKLYEKLSEKYNVNIELKHLMKDRWS